MSVKQWVSAHGGATVVVYRDGADYYAEDWQERLPGILAKLEAKGYEVLQSDDDASIHFVHPLTPGKTGFINKPMQSRVEHGTLQARATFFTINGIRYDIKGFRVDGDALAITYEDGRTTRIVSADK